MFFAMQLLLIFLELAYCLFHLTFFAFSVPGQYYWCKHLHNVIFNQTCVLLVNKRKVANCRCMCLFVIFNAGGVLFI